MSTNRAWLRPVLYLVGLALLSAGLIAATTGPARAAAVGHPATTVTVLRPVNATGHVARGWKVVTDKRAPISCDERSYVAVDKGIDWCGGSADNTLACWKSATRGRVLCVGPDDAMKRTLRSIKLSGPFGTKRAEGGPQPIALHMRNGMTMYARDGGAWESVKQHPSWVGWFYEPGRFAHTIYAPRSCTTGLNENGPGWFGTVYHDPTKPGYHAWVATAYFVGTAR